MGVDSDMAVSINWGVLSRELYGSFKGGGGWTASLELSGWYDMVVLYGVLWLLRELYLQLPTKTTFL